MNHLLLRAGALGAILLVSACGGSDSGKSAAPPPKIQAPLVPKKEMADWCGEHTVPESICTRCNVELVAGFKKKGDWCVKHELPESQCFKCHPELEAKFKAMAPK